MADTSEEELRCSWRLRWLTAIQSFADTATQKERWLDPAENNPHFSFVECMCVYFDDVLWGKAEAYKEQLDRGLVTIAEVAALAEFHALADSYDPPNGDDWDSHAVLGDPAWQEVVRAAAGVQERLLPLLPDEAEREALTRPEQWIQEGNVYAPQRIGASIVQLREK